MSNADLMDKLVSLSKRRGYIFQSSQIYGGTGKSFSWERARDCREKPVVLAGGLSALNVAEAIMVSGAYGIDVSTGVESTPGIKDPRKINDLVAVVRACNQAVTAVAESGKGIL